MTSTRKNRILIADDEPVNQELLEAFLADEDYELEFANDGLETIVKTRSFQPDLILLDVMMPKMSGFEVCQQLKNDPETSGIIILMVTALSELGDVERAVNVGCDDYVSKPIHKLEL
ncbi:MAG: response regulator, partial [Thermoguttaceae bacterium]|nr:response regulator [Thermoguttaceae bacterium]